MFTLHNWHAINVSLFSATKIENRKSQLISNPDSLHFRGTRRRFAYTFHDQVFDVSTRRPMKSSWGKREAGRERIRLFEMDFSDVTAIDRYEISAITRPREPVDDVAQWRLKIDPVLHEINVFFTLLTLTDLCLERHVARTDYWLLVCSPDGDLVDELLYETKLTEYILRSTPARCAALFLRVL